MARDPKLANFIPPPGLLIKPSPAKYYKVSEFQPYLPEFPLGNGAEIYQPDSRLQIQNFPPPAPAQQATYTPAPAYVEPNYAMYMPGTAKSAQQATRVPAPAQPPTQAPSQPAIVAPKPIPAPRRTPSPQPPLDASTQAGGSTLRAPSPNPPARLRTPSPQPAHANGLLSAAQAVTGAIEALVVVNESEPASTPANTNTQRPFSYIPTGYVPPRTPSPQPPAVMTNHQEQDQVVPKKKEKPPVPPRRDLSKVEILQPLPSAPPLYPVIAGYEFPAAINAAVVEYGQYKIDDDEKSLLS